MTPTKMLHRMLMPGLCCLVQALTPAVAHDGDINSDGDINVVGWTMAFCGCAASRITPSSWSPSVAPTVGALGERRGFCPSCGARRMAQSAVLLVDEVLPEQPMRQCV